MKKIDRHWTACATFWQLFSKELKSMSLLPEYRKMLAFIDPKVHKFASASCQRSAVAGALYDVANEHAKGICTLFENNHYASGFALINALNSYTHGGQFQVTRRYDGSTIQPHHDPEELEEILRFSAMLTFLTFGEIAEISESEELHGYTEELYGKISPWCFNL